MNTPVWLYDIDSYRIQFANAAALQVWQATSEAELVERDLALDMTPTVSSRLKQYQRDFKEEKRTFNELWTIYPNGEPTTANVVFSGFLLDDGRIGMLCEVVGVCENDSPENLRSAEALLHTDVMISLYSIDGPPLYLNPAARKSIRSAGQDFKDIFVSSDEHSTFIFELDRVGEHRSVVKARTTEGVRWHDITAKLCADAATGAPSVLITAIDVSELKNARDKARFLADRDVLTGSFNRLFLQHYMTELSRRTDTACTAVYFDIDHFKQLNDTHGHEVGDVVLKEIADRARSNLREQDKLIRLGGDEFVVVLENTEVSDDRALELDQLQVSLSEPIYYDAFRLSVSVSMGVTTFNPAHSEYATVLREADMALYKAKAEGRNRWVIYTPALGLKAQKQRSVENEIKRAIEHNEFVLHFQPRINLETGKMVSAEALVRWVHPERGLIMPDKFIPLCEDTGLILDLGQLVVHAGCDKAIASSMQHPSIGFSINISPRQFDDPRLLESLKQYASRTDFPSGMIELEITENVLIGNLTEIESKLRSISDLGYQIAVDDFGTGYSNLSYISRFPLNCLKIDRSFIQQLPASGPVIRLILTLAEQIGARTVAEGVETRAERDWLVEQNCTEAQGYFFSKPLSGLEFASRMSADTGV